jgi:hypothetical protein
METECFYCDAGAEFIYIIQITIPGHVALHFKCQIFITVVMKSATIWDIPPCSPLSLA